MQMYAWERYIKVWDETEGAYMAARWSGGRYELTPLYAGHNVLLEFRNSDMLILAKLENEGPENELVATGCPAPLKLDMAGHIWLADCYPREIEAPLKGLG